MKYILIDTSGLIQWMKVTANTYLVDERHVSEFLEIMGGNINEL